MVVFLFPVCECTGSGRNPEESLGKCGVRSWVLGFGGTNPFFRGGFGGRPSMHRACGRAGIVSHVLSDGLGGKQEAGLIG